MAILHNFGVTLQGLRFAVAVVGPRLKQCHTQAMQARHLRGWVEVEVLTERFYKIVIN